MTGITWLMKIFYGMQNRRPPNNPAAHYNLKNNFLVFSLVTSSVTNTTYGPFAQ